MQGKADRELLELAARACGYDYTDGLLQNRACDFEFAGWNPLIDSNDAFDLAVDLLITVEQDIMETKASAYVLVGGKRNHFSSVSGKVTRAQATRRAIVLAAAHLGSKK